MKVLAYTILVLALISCGPRDDEKLMGQGGPNSQGFDLQSGGLSITTEGAKLPSCTKPDQPTWSTVRLYKETAFLFDKVKDLKVVVGRGDFNCVPISNSQPVEVEVQEAQWRKTGVFYFVTKLAMLNLNEFLNDSDSVKKTASDMAMSEVQLREFLTAGTPRPQITITYLKSVDGVTAPAKNNYTLESGYVLSAEKEGLKLPTCNDPKDPTWSTLRLPFALNELLPKANEMSVIVSNQARNCVPVSLQKTVQLEVQDKEDSPYKGNGQFYLVQKLSLVNREYLLSDANWLKELATSMQISDETLKNYLQADTADEVVSLAYLVPSEEISDPVLVPILEIRLPGDEGKTLSECGDKPWTDVRLVPEANAQKALEIKTLKAIVNSGEKNCLPLGSEVSISIKTDKWVPFEGGKIKITGVMSLDKSQFQKIPFLGEKVSEEMGMNLSDFIVYVEGLKGNMVNVTRFEWVE